MRTRPTLLFAITAALLTTGSARAQLFGPRTVGPNQPSSSSTARPGAMGTAQQGLSLGQSGGSAPGLGAVRAANRFNQSNRGAGNFIGSSDQGAGFVGLLQSEAAPIAARSAVTTAPPPPVRVNRVPTAASSQNRPYDPRLKVDFERPSQDATALSGKLSNRLTELLNRGRVQGQLELALEDSTAILRGTVVSAGQRTLVEQLVRLEPGVGQVRNELRIEPLATSPPAARP